MPKIVDAATAVKSIPKGKRIFLGSGAALPVALVKALEENASHFLANEIVQILTLGPAGYAKAEYQDNFRTNNFFIGHNMRKAVQEGFADFTPIFLGEIPRLFRSGSYPLKAALVCVTPPDKNGMCSLGVSVDVVKAAVENADILIAQINRHMPRTYGQTFVPYSRFDYVVEEDFELPELHPTGPDPITDGIAKNVASLIRDGDVLQLGIGAIPDSVLRLLTNRNDLGIHTEMLSDGVMNLMKAGNVTNRTKTVMKDRSLSSFAIGTKALYEYLHENPLVEFYPNDFTNDPFNVAKNDNMVCINSALQIDLTGQICADSLGSKLYSGIGGQVDFMRGAARSKHGRPIIALPSTAAEGKFSRIAGQLSPGAGVVTSRGDAHYIVTEYGIAQLHGKNVRERALALIQIAHPDFRDELLSFVKQNKYVYFDQKLMDHSSQYPEEVEEYKTFTGKELFFRPIKITDDRKLQDFFYSEDIADLYNEYLDIPKEMDRYNAGKFADVDYQRQMALVVLEPTGFSEKIVAIGRFTPTAQEDTVELKVVVGEGYRGMGIGFHICKKLIRFSHDKPFLHIITRFKTTNKRMKKMMDELGSNLGYCRIEMIGEYYTYHFTPAGV